MESETELEPLPAAPELTLVEKVGPHATKIMLGAAVVGLVSVLLPAVMIEGEKLAVTTRGVEGLQGKLGLLCYLAVGVMTGLMLRKPDMPSAKNLSLGCLCCAGVTALMALWLLIDIGRAPKISGFGIEIKTGIGPYLNILASLVLAAGSVFQAKKEKVF